MHKQTSPWCSSWNTIPLSLNQRTHPRKGQSWNAELDRLSPFVKSEPHDNFAAFTIALFGHQMYFLRTTEGIAPLLQPLEDLPAPHSSTDWTEWNLIPRT